MQPPGEWRAVNNSTEEEGGQVSFWKEHRKPWNVELEKTGVRWNKGRETGGQGGKERSQTAWIEFSNVYSHYTSFHKTVIVSDKYLHLQADTCAFCSQNCYKMI